MVKSTKNISEEILKEIKKSHNILLHLHPSPDGDSIGSALSMFFALKQLGKKATVISGDSDLPNFINYFPGHEAIVQNNFFQLDLSKFDLFIILDTASTNQISKFGDIKFPNNLKTITIDHHPTNSGYSEINLIVGNAPATCQILFSLYKKWGIEINKEIAACLLVGLYTDTGGFKYLGTTYKTLEIASKLSKIYPDFTDIIFEIENSDTPEKIKFLSVALNSVSTYFGNQVAISSVSYESIEKNGISRKSFDTSYVSNMLKAVTGWNIGICMIEVQPGIVKVSYRTRKPKLYDLGQIAAATGSGGGHIAAAGATINKPLPEAIIFLLETIRKTHPELNNP